MSIYISLRKKLFALVLFSVATITVTSCASSSHITMDLGADSPMGSESIPSGVNVDDIMFSQMMIPHHEQAVTMAELALDRTQDPATLELAAQIQAAQDPEIELMASWLEQWGMPRLTGAEAEMSHGSHGMLGMLSDSQLGELASAEGERFNELFAQFMIEHHLGAIDMAREVLASGQSPDVAELARKIIVEQEKEILLLRSLLNSSPTAASVAINPPLDHVHGAIVVGGSLLIGTHDGLHTVDPVSGRSSRVGTSRDDLMGFGGDPERILVASGHPGAGSSMQNPLGLMRSIDAGVNWEAVSLQGEVDFHGLVINGDNVVGWDTRGTLQWSSDAGKSWKAGPPAEPTSLTWFRDRVWIGSAEYGLSTWQWGTQEVVQMGIPGVLVTAAPDGTALWKLDADGSVHRSLDGASWQGVGAAQGAQAIAASRSEVFLVTGSTIQRFTAG